MSKVVTFGEIMMRLTTPGHKRFLQALPGPMDCTFAGAEANVAASLALLGLNSCFVTALPDNYISQACLNNLRQIGVKTDYTVKSDEGRLGTFYLETGANQRPSNVIYDRMGSSISRADISMFDFPDMFNNTDWFHITGVTPALSQEAFLLSLEAVKQAKKHHLQVSIDLNFRGKLWKWDKSLTERQLAKKSIEQMLPFADVVIGNEEDAYDVLDIKAGNSQINTGKLDISGYIATAAAIAQRFPNISKIAFTLRESISASHNNWGGMLYDTTSKKACFGPANSQGDYTPYEIKNIVDRVGGGDSFSAGLIYAMLDNELNQDNDLIVRFAAAASCLAHSLEGDFNFANRSEVLRLMSGNASGRVVR